MNPIPATETTAQHSIPRTLLRVAVYAAALMIVPLTASFLTPEMEWTLSDYVLVWMMLCVTGSTYAFVSRKSKRLSYHAAVAIASFSGLFIVWSNLAVGIVGNEDNPFNIIYFILILGGIIGAFWVKFEPKGLSYVTGAMVLALIGIAGYALIAGFQDIPKSSVMEILGVHMFLITPLSIAAILFHQEP